MRRVRSDRSARMAITATAAMVLGWTAACRGDAPADPGSADPAAEPAAPVAAPGKQALLEQEPGAFRDRRVVTMGMDMAALHWAPTRVWGRPGEQGNVRLAGTAPTGGHALEYLGFRLLTDAGEPIADGAPAPSGEVIAELACRLTRPAEDAMVTQALEELALVLPIDPRATHFRIVMADTTRGREYLVPPALQKVVGTRPLPWVRDGAEGPGATDGDGR